MMKKFLIVAVVVGLLGLLVIPAIANGGWGMGYGQRGVTSNGAPLSVEEHEKWLDQQVKDGWLTQKQADSMQQMYRWKVDGVSEQEYLAWLDKQVKDGWMTQKQADWLKENYKLDKEKYGENASFRMGMGMGGQAGVNCPMGGRGRGLGRGMMGGRW